MNIDDLRFERNNLSQNIIWLRNHYELSKRDMMKIMGIGAKTLDRIENGELPKRLKASALIRLCERFDIKADELLYSTFHDRQPEGRP